MIWPATPTGFGLPVRERVLELVRPARVVEEVRGRERQVDVARLLDRLAAVQRLEHGELARALLEDARDAEEVLRALRAGQRRPAVRERVARGGDGAVDVLARCPAPIGASGSSSRGRDRRVRLRRLDPLAADEEAVALARAGRCRATPARARTSSPSGPARGPVCGRAQSMVK